MKCFSIDTETNIYIYGAGSLGRSCAGFLMRQNYHLAGYLDQHADQLQDDELPVQNPAAISPSKNDAVIVCVHNALWHGEIAESLFKQGWERILFLPFDSRYATAAAEEMKKKYFAFSCNDLSAFSDIPLLTELHASMLTENASLLFDMGDYVVTWIDVTTLYTSLNEKTIRQRNAGEAALRYIGLPMPAMMPYVSLFRHMEDESRGNTDDFIRVMKKLQDTFEVSDDSFIADRYDLYYSLKRKLNRGMDPFLYSAPDCVWDAKGFFHLKDGMSRTTFLYVQGFQFVPVRMTKSEYQDWRNLPVLEEVVSFIKREQIDSLPYAVEHPDFHDFPEQFPGRTFMVLSAVQEYLNCHSLKNKKAVNQITGFGQLSRYFARQGAGVIETGPSPVPEEMFHNLLRVPGIIRMEPEYFPDDCDILCMETGPSLSAKDIADITSRLSSIKDLMIVVDTGTREDLSGHPSCVYTKRIFGSDPYSICILKGQRK